MLKTLLSLVALLLLGMPAIAQDSPEPDEPAVDSTTPTETTYTSEIVRQRKVLPNGQVAYESKEMQIPTNSYYSHKLKGHFRAEWMFLNVNGEQTNFWGARIKRLDTDSAIKKLGLLPGDVLTRLDGIGIARGMYREQGQTWQISELDRHFGNTEVIYVIHNDNKARRGQINLGQDVDDDDAPVRP
jgi:hypothetical protein